MMENATRVELTGLHRQVREQTTEMDRLKLQHHRDKSLNKKWKTYDDQREKYVITLTEAYQKSTSEVTVLNSFLRDSTSDLREAEEKIGQLENRRGSDKEVELINADLRIETQRGVIEEQCVIIEAQREDIAELRGVNVNLEQKLSEEECRFIKLQDKYFWLQDDLSQSRLLYHEQVKQAGDDLKAERKNRRQIEHKYNDLRSCLKNFNSEGCIHRCDNRQDINECEKSALSARIMKKSSESISVTEKSISDVRGHNDNEVGRKLDNGYFRELKYSINFEESDNCVNGPIGTSDNIWLNV